MRDDTQAGEHRLPHTVRRNADPRSGNRRSVFAGRCRIRGAQHRRDDPPGSALGRWRRGAGSRGTAVAGL